MTNQLHIARCANRSAAMFVCALYGLMVFVGKRIHQFRVFSSNRVSV